MKKLSVLLPLFFCSLFAFGQVDWVFDNQFGHDNMRKIIRLGNQQFVILHDDEFGVISVLSKEGVNLFEGYANGNLSGYPEVYAFNSLFETPDNTFAATTSNIGYDPSTMMAYEYFALLQYYPDFGVSQSFAPYTDFGASFSGGDYLLANIEGMEIARLNTLSQFLWTLALPGYDFNDMRTTTADSILLATQQGLLSISPAGLVASEFPNYIFQRIKLNEQGMILGIREDSAFVVSPNFQLLEKIRVPNGPIKDFDIKKDTIALLSATDSVHLMGINLNPINSFLLPDDAQFKFIMLGEDKLELAGDERYGDPVGNNATFASFVKSYSYDGTDFELSNDAGIESIVQSGDIITVPFGTGYKLTFEEISITARNHGSNSINTLYLRTTQGKSMRFDNIDLLPGESKTLTWENLEQTFLDNPIGQTIGLCLWTSHPDFRLDLDNSNDISCADFLVNEEELKTENSLTLFPNPTANMLNCSIISDHRYYNPTYRVVGMHGRVVMSQQEGKNSLSISVENWVPGVYCLQLFEENSLVAARRFVVIH